jgi:alkylhydroperoxidase family enzyme
MHQHDHTMYLPDVEGAPGGGPHAERIAQAKRSGMPFPQIWHLFAFKPEMGEAMSQFTQVLMRGPSRLSPGMRELIAAFTSRRNQCLF